MLRLITGRPWPSGFGSGTTAEQVTGSNLTAIVTDSSASSICSVNTKQQADIVAFHLQGVDTHSLPRSFPTERKLEQDNSGVPKKDRVVTNSLASISCRTDLNSHGGRGILHEENPCSSPNRTTGASADTYGEGGCLSCTPCIIF